MLLKILYSVTHAFAVIFQHVFSVAICWILSYILTKYGAFSDDPRELSYNARTDAKLDVLTKADWFLIPYPCKNLHSN